MSEVADFRISRDDSLLNVDRAHKAVEKINIEIDEAVDAAILKINAHYAPRVFLSQSVLYEAMSKAAEAGFTRQDMVQVMECDGH